MLRARHQVRVSLVGCDGASEEQETAGSASIRVDAELHGNTADSENDYGEQMSSADLRESSEPRRHSEDRQYDVRMDQGCEAARRDSRMELADFGAAVLSESCLRKSQTGGNGFVVTFESRRCIY